MEDKIPYEVQTFLLLMHMNGILTWDNLQKKGWTGPNICVICKHREGADSRAPIYNVHICYKNMEITHDLRGY